MSTSAVTPALDVSVVVPVYGGERTIGPLADGLAASFAAAGLRWELIFVCDRPRDGSWAIASGLAAEREEVSAVLLMRNFGQHPATLLGIRRARGRVIVTMDEDLQHSPADVPALVAAAEAIGGVAYGVFDEVRHSWFRGATSAWTRRFLTWYTRNDNARYASAFRAFPARLRRAFDDYRGERVAIDVLLSWAGAPITQVRCQHGARDEGTSGYTLRKLLGLLADIVVGYTVAPLRLASTLGLLAIALSFAIGAFVLVNWIINGSAVPGFAFLALSISMFSGVQLIALGVMGEYIGRMYVNSLGKPQYIVGEVVDSADAVDIAP